MFVRHIPYHNYCTECECMIRMESSISFAWSVHGLCRVWVHFTCNAHVEV